VFGCRHFESRIKTNSTETQITATSQVFSLTDSLEKYYSADSVLLIDDKLGATLFIGKANSCQYGVWIIPDSILIFFQHRINESWSTTDTLRYKLIFSFAQQIDLNGDRLKDIRVSCISGVAANTENSVFLFDRGTNSFKHNAYYDLPNVEYDAENHFVKSWWFSGYTNCQEKGKYIITGDSLTFDLGVSYCPDEKTHGKTGTLKFFKKNGQKEITIKKVNGKSNKIWSLFTQSLWDTDNK
jgi:hypothetical protein